MKYLCPVCGNNDLDYPPQDYHICPCCTTEFGNDDFAHSHSELRQIWIEGGCKWWYRTPTEGWDAAKQLFSLLDILQQENSQLQGDVLHPENRCQRCGGKNITWSTDNDLWNKYVDRNVILCPICFARSCEPDIGYWKLSPRRDHEAQTLKQKQTLPSEKEAKSAEDETQGTRV